ncbi:MAG: HlyD family efflux transporter periplasmic adaptor subunit [Rhizomicrobium sp.]|jgi:membrane fusion protein (multidrug efflux system)
MAAFKPIGWLKGEDLQHLSKEDRQRQLRQRLFAVLFSVIAAVAVAAGGWWYFVSSNYVSTDNAYVNVSSAQVTPLTSGAALSVPVHDTQAVRRGDVLLVIDPQDAKLLYAQANAAYGMTIRKVQTYFAAVAVRRADYDRTKLDYDRRVNLVKSGAVSSEELTAVKNNFESAKAGLDAALALTHGTNVMNHPEVLAAKAALDTAKLNLDRTVIRAPVDGLVAQRQVQIGQRVQAGMPVMVIVPISQVYVDANYKEDQLGKVRPGQSATLTCDLYGSSVEFHGRVMGIGGGTGSAFAVIPAQNATGNWIKVVQRIPVRISLDPNELKEHPLRVGLSMSVSIDVSK